MNFISVAFGKKCQFIVDELDPFSTFEAVLVM
jgi:hypothetical protein